MTRSRTVPVYSNASVQEGYLEVLAPPRPDDADHLALIFGECRITYAQLRAEVSCLAGGLRKILEPGELLTIWLPNSPELLCLYLACLKTGIVPMPLHQGMKWPEMSEVLHYSEAQWLITSRAVAEPHAAELASMSLRGIYIVDPDNSPSLARYFRYSDLKNDEGSARESHELTRIRADHSRDSSDSRAKIPLAGSDLALVLHTSGSHGHPKGVMLSRANLEHVLRYRLAHTLLGPQSVSIVASCLTQSVGFYQSLALLAAGGSIVLLEAYDIDRLVDGLHRHRPTHLIMVVDAFDRLLHHPAITAESLRCLTFASTGADRVTARVQDRFIALTGRPLRVSYGLTESSWALLNSGDSPAKCLALGQPCPGIEIKLADAHGREVSQGHVGEIWIKSPRTMLGYLRDAALTRAAFVEGWLLTGDLASRDAEGCYWFAGRKKHLIVLSSGDNVSPLEVENAILSHPAVSNCAVIGMATPQGSEVPWAAITRRDEALTAAALEEFLRTRISDFKIPQKFVFLAELPVGRSGKVHREEARRMLAEESNR